MIEQIPYHAIADWAARTKWHTPKPPLREYKYPQNGALRNKECPCGSGRKFKKCCWNKEVKNARVSI